MTQHSSVHGEHNTVVQLSGDGHTVLIGYPHLKLTRFEAEQRASVTDARILLAKARAIPIEGRDAELADLLNFVSADATCDVRARVLIGDGGTGKTRLALALCDQIKDTWNAGFVTTDALDRFFKQQNASEWGWQKPTLIVLDYAAAHASVLGKWLNELVDRAPPKSPLRLLLLERHADPTTGWHKAVFSPGGGSSLSTSELLDPPEPVLIRPLTNQFDRLTIVRSVIERAAPQLLDKLTQDPTLPQQIKDSRWAGEPLYLAMAALTMAREDSAAAFKLGRTDLALKVAGHEQRRLTVLAESKNLDPELLHHLCACITLAQGWQRSAAIEWVGPESRSAGFGQTAAPLRLVNVLHEAFPDHTDPDQIAYLQPDLIGEAFVLNAWDKPECANAVIRLFDSKPKQLIESLVRLMQDFDATDERPAQWFNSLIHAHWDDYETLQAIDTEVPSLSYSLSEINVTLSTRQLDLERKNDESNPVVIAARLNNQAIAFARAGRREEALTAAQETVTQYRDLARQQSDAFIPQLAGALNNLAGFLSALGQREAALSAANEASALFRELARQRPAAFTPDLALALNNQATFLGDLGQREAALTVANVATSLYRDLTRQRPDAFTPDLAGALNNLANRLSALGQREGALSAANEASSLYRDLARQRPDAFTPNLAGALNNLAGYSSALGQREAALSAAREATYLYRDLARRRPDAFTPDLARALNNQATFLGNLGQREAALSSAQEATSLYRDLARQRPDAFTPDLARALNNQATFLGKLGQSEAALSSAQEANSLYRDLARQRPDAFTPDLAGTLNNLANRLSAVEQREKALSAADEATSLFRDLAHQRPDAFTPDLARALSDQANHLSALGQLEAALSAANEATSLNRDLARQRPETFTPNLAGVLNNLAAFLSALGQHEAALSVANEATSLYRDLARQQPDAFTPDLARSLIVLAIQTEATLGANAAVIYAHEAVSTLSPAFLIHPQVHEGVMTAMIRDYVHMCEASKIDPDIALLSPLLAIFNRKSKD